MKKLNILVIVSIFCATFNMSAQQFAGGSGTVSDPYIITTPLHLESMHDVNYGEAGTPVARYFRLDADLDMTGVNWFAINPTDPYEKHIHFDGNGHVIKNLTVFAQEYASLFGVLCGSCRNLGVIDANVESSNSSGIIAGYVGLKGPNKPTGLIENCYTTGTISGIGAAGGITGNIGKPNGDVFSIVRNCYSTATVIVPNISGAARSGGVVGIVWEKGVLENCYSTGKVICYGTEAQAGAGGVVGHSDASLKGCVALNDSIINMEAVVNIGRIAAFMGRVNDVQAQGEKCWGHDGIVMKNFNTVVQESELSQGTVERNKPYDGISKNAAYLSDPMNYFLELEWDFASDENVWAQTMSNGRPIFQWLVNRADYQDIDGHHSKQTGVQYKEMTNINVLARNGKISISSDNQIHGVKIYALSGQAIFDKSFSSNSISFSFDNQGIFVFSILTDGKWQNRNLLISK